MPRELRDRFGAFRQFARRDAYLPQLYTAGLRVAQIGKLFEMTTPYVTAALREYSIVPSEHNQRGLRRDRDDLLAIFNSLNSEVLAAVLVAYNLDVDATADRFRVAMQLHGPDGRFSSIHPDVITRLSQAKAGFQSGEITLQDPQN